MAGVEIDLYEVLEVSRSATKDEIRKAYRKVEKTHTVLIPAGNLTEITDSMVN